MKNLLAALAIAMVCTAGASGAATLTANDLLSPYAGLGSNDPAAGSSDQQVADDFSLTSDATVRSVQWWGNYSQDETFPGTTSFELRIFSDDGSGYLPLGSSLFSQTLNVIGFSTGITTSGDGRLVYSYTANLAPLILTAGDYWISIVENDSNTSAVWEWTSTENGGGSQPAIWHGYSSWITGCGGVPDAQFCVSPSLRDRAFALYDQPIAPVPLPASLPLLFGGLVGLGWIARRRRS